MRLQYAAFASVGCMELGAARRPVSSNGNYRHGTRTKEAIQAVRYVNLLSRLARKS